MPYKKGDEFTIKITDVMTGEDGTTVYRMNDFASLVFDEHGLDQLEKMEKKEVVGTEKENPFERVRSGDWYYSIFVDGTLDYEAERGSEDDDAQFSVANYCTDKAMMEQRALHETLNRLLWRYSEEHGGDPGQWGPGSKHWYIFKRTSMGGNITTAWNDDCRIQGVPYFRTEELALNAIHDIIEPFMAEHPEFVW